jgi:serine protease Do
MEKMKRLILITLCLALTGFVQIANGASSSPNLNLNLNPISTPVPKSAEKAAADLKREIPLDPAKLGDPLPRNLFIELSKLINPTVVSITTTTNPRMRGGQGGGGGGDPLQEFLEQFWGAQGGGGGFMQPRPPQPMMALGTGFIIREDGLIVTNNHVVEQADIIKVQLDANSEKFYEAELIGRDSMTDIALIKIDAKKPLPYARLGSSKEVQVGEWVAAFGNPYGHAHTMTKGIVSALGREIAEINRVPFIQTDASINPGNSGGPLVNTEGLVIGVNTAIDARAQGIGFAIPIDSVKQVLEPLEKEGRIKRGYIGIGIGEISDEIAANLGMSEPKGIIVTQVQQGGAADKAGIRPYDIIVDFGGKKTDSPAELQNAVGATAIGSSAKAKIWRYKEDGSHRELSMNVKVAENPEDGKKSGRTRETKKYFGQNAPFDLGFKTADYTAALAGDFHIPPEIPHNPVITEVTQGSKAALAGLQPGDVFLDINRQQVSKATDVIKLLKKGRNIIRLIRGNMTVIVTIG